MTSHHDTFANDCPQCAVERSQNNRSTELLQDYMDENYLLRADIECLRSERLGRMATMVGVGLAVGIWIGMLI